MDPSRQLPEELRGDIERREHPTWVEPMLARLTDGPFSDAGWVFERKLDGERCLAFRSGSNIRLLSRNRERLDGTYPELVDALAAQAEDDFVVDGEVVAFSGNVTSFSRLQGRMQIRDPEAARASRIAVYYYVFDLPYMGGYDLTRLPLRQRKKLLRRALSFDNRVRFTPHRNEDGAAFYRQACERGWEGLLAKEADSPYLHSRSSRWLKVKCVNRQEFVVGGFTEPQSSRQGFGALLLGYYDGDELIYAGRVGTGFDDATLKDLAARLESLEVDAPVFADRQPTGKGVHWVEPRLVAEVAFTEWTGDGKLRHPRYEGLRRDKSARDVVREEVD